MQFSSLIVRLPNHLGDACMALPALDLLSQQGIALTLAGRAWAPELFSAYPWRVAALPAGRTARIAALHDLRPLVARQRQALLLTNSFSSALEFRLAGLLPAGYARDARRLLLHPAIGVPPAWAGRLHTVGYYHHLARVLLDPRAARCEPLPAPPPRLQLDEAARARAVAARARAGAGPRYLVVCPVAQGRHHGRDKCWNGFGRLVDELVAAGNEVLTCPGPGEGAAAAAAAPRARVVEALDLAAFAALLAAARLVLANDSGPGHLAAAVGARLIGVFGVTDPTKTRPQGSAVQIVGGIEGWPHYTDVAGAVASALRDD